MLLKICQILRNYIEAIVNFKYNNNLYCHFMQAQPRKKQQDILFTFFADKEDLLKTIDSIKLTNCPKLKYCFGFSSPYTMQYFINVLNRQCLQDQTAQSFKLAYYDTQKGRFSRLKFTRDQSFTQVVRLKFYSTLRLIVFMKIYAQRIVKMESEYQYQLIPGKEGNLHVYMKQKNLSNMFRNQVSQMKRQLSCLQIRNQRYCQKVIYSKKFDKIFQKDQIKAELWYKEKLPCIVFYTFHMKQENLRKIVLQKLQYHLTIMKFIDYKADYLVNCILFRLMQGRIQQQIQEIKNQFDMEIQFNEDKCGIVIHDMDIVFQKQVKQSVLNTFSSLTFVSIKDKGIRNLSNLLKRKPEEFQQISTFYYKETLYLCFDKDTLDKSILKRLYYKIAQHISLDSVIIFSWFQLTQKQHGRLRQEIVKNISNSVQNSPFTIQNFKSFANDSDRRAVLKLKQFDLDNKASQYDEIVDVLFDSTHRNQRIPIKVVQSSSQQQYSIEQIAQIGQIDQIDQIDQLDQTPIFQSQNQSVQKNQKGSSSSQQGQNSSKQSPFQHIQPQISQMQQELVWKTSKRDRLLQDKFGQYYQKSAKIWRLQLNQKYCKNIKIHGKISCCRSRSLNNSMKIQNQDIVNIKNCEDQELLIGIHQIQLGLFVPIYIVKLIGRNTDLFGL